MDRKELLRKMLDAIIADTPESNDEARGHFHTYLTNLTPTILNKPTDTVPPVDDSE